MAENGDRIQINHRIRFLLGRPILFSDIIFNCEKADIGSL